MKWTPYSRLVSVHTQNNENNDRVWIRYEQAEKSGEVCVWGRAGLLVKEMYLSLNARESYPIFWQLESVPIFVSSFNPMDPKKSNIKTYPWLFIKSLAPTFLLKKFISAI